MRAAPLSTGVEQGIIKFQGDTKPCNIFKCTNEKGKGRMRLLRHHIFFHLISWLIAYNIFGLFVYMLLKNVQESGVKLADNLIWASFAAIVISLLLGVTDYYFDRIERHFKSFIKVILSKSILYILVISLTILFGILLSFIVFGEIDIKAFLMSPAFSTIFLFSIIICIILNFTQQVNKKFGQGELWAVMLGKYFKPKVEKRIFMFLDLQSSTRYAEQLGHIKYSELIQRCFDYINLVVSDYSASLYQYVGDEVVLTWKWEDGLKNNRCIGLYFALVDLISQKADRLRKEFGIVPEFKAGVHGGYITVAEVGDIKKEIAYHGDVINTAARIQGKCNSFNSKFLVSKIIHNNLRDHRWSSKEIGEVKLKGKLKPVVVYSILNQ